MAARFAVVACSDCKTYWAVEQRFEKVRCGRCGRQWPMQGRKKFWEGNVGRDAIVAVQSLMAQRFQG